MIRPRLKSKIKQLLGEDGEGGLADYYGDLLGEKEIDGIERILAMYVVNSGMLKQARYNRPTKGLEQIEHLIKSAQQFHDDLHTATARISS